MNLNMKLFFLLLVLIAYERPIARAFVPVPSVTTATQHSSTIIKYQNSASYLEQQFPQVERVPWNLVTNGVSAEYRACIADLYEDVAVVFRSAAAHGDGSITMSTLEEHLKGRADDSAASDAIISSMIDILYSKMNKTGTLEHRDVSLQYEDATNALAESIAA